MELGNYKRSRSGFRRDYWVLEVSSYLGEVVSGWVNIILGFGLEMY